MKQDNKGTCFFEKTNKNLTVGDTFELHCEWPSSLILQPPLSVQINDNPYGLVILDILSLNSGKGSFKVTGYQPGVYQSHFKIVSAKDTVYFSHSGWTITSVLPPQQANTLQPYPPYGPWKAPLPGWYWISGTFCIILILVWGIYKWIQFNKRKTFLQKIQDRLKGRNALYEFIKQVTLLNRQINNLANHQVIHRLKSHWQHFLENELLIPTEGKKLKHVIKFIKHFHPLLYKRHIQDIIKFWIELENNLPPSQKLTDRDCEQLLTLSRQISATIHQRGSY